MAYRRTEQEQLQDKRDRILPAIRAVAGEVGFWGAHVVIVAEAEAHWARPFELMDGRVFNSEDLPTCEQIQRGMGSGASERLIVDRLEQNLRRFHANLDAALG